MTNHSSYVQCRRLTRALLLTIFTTLCSTAALAIDYDVEIIVFEHARSTSVGRSDTLLVPVIPGARDIPLQVEANSPIQPLPELRLQAEAAKIKASDAHRLIYHGGWRQTDFDEESAPYMKIALGQQIPVFTEPGDEDSNYLRGYPSLPLNTTARLDRGNTATIFGGIKVWVGRFLHFDTLLSYTPRGGNQSYPMHSDRRLRSRQLHYIDNPRMGIITKIFPVDETAPN